MDAFLGEIRMFSGNYAPENWLPCDGRTIQVSQYNALFSLLGTTYGGDGVNTFGIPDLRGRVPVGAGQGLNLPPVTLGQRGGAEFVQLTEANMPAHTHTLNATSTPGNINLPTGALHAYTSPQGTNSDPEYNTNAAAQDIKMNAGIVGEEYGQNAPISLVQPYFTTSMIICVVGNYPS